uniref:Putative secreted protein n=1 Tax=Anopheles darlingi TaxID=43151 RepID=A0A2M4DMZ2_ANODA
MELVSGQLLVERFFLIFSPATYVVCSMVYDHGHDLSCSLPAGYLSWLGRLQLPPPLLRLPLQVLADGKAGEDGCSALASTVAAPSPDNRRPLRVAEA